MSRFIGLFLCLLLTSCASMGSYSKHLHFLDTYEAALHQYKQGRIMSARGIVLRIEKSKKDYAAAQKLLYTKIEPSRKKLLNHYLQEASKRERAGQWSLAVSAYQEATRFSLHDEAIQAKSKRVQRKVQAIRIQRIRQQANSDLHYFDGLQETYRLPKGFAADDAVFVALQKQASRAIRVYIQNTLSIAKDMQEQDFPEVAYVLTHTCLQLRPDDHDATVFMAKLHHDWPDDAPWPPVAAVQSIQYKPALVRPKKPKKPKKKAAYPMQKEQQHLQQLMRDEQWLQALAQAKRLLDHGSRAAAELIPGIELELQAEAEDVYQLGIEAYRNENIDLAVKYWSQAAELQPENKMYRQEMNRAKVLQERLRIIDQSSNQHP